MSLELSKIISAIESEIKSEYLPGAIQWADENHGGAWSAAIERFDKSLSRATEWGDVAGARAAVEFYSTTVIDLLSKYKADKGLDDVNAFLSSITKPEEKRQSPTQMEFDQLAANDPREFLNRVRAAK